MENPSKPTSPQEQEIALECFSDLRGKNLTDKDFSTVPLKDIFTVTFDSETIWPSVDKLPVGFNPEKVLEDGKNPGLGIRDLHSEGITGEGITVAIIDQKLDVEHIEYKNSLTDYSEYGDIEIEPISMHGPAVASLLVGKECGTAPCARLVFKAMPSGDRSDLFNPSKALEDIIEENKTLSAKDKIRIVSCSFGGRMGEYKTELGYDVWNSTVEKAKDAGIIMLGGGHFGFNGVGFGGCGSFGDRENTDAYFGRLYEKDSDWKNLVETLMRDDFEEFRKIFISFDPTISNLSDSEFRDFFKEFQLLYGKNKKNVLVPEDYRTYAFSLNKTGEYCYSGIGGMSWTYPWLAGVYAMALQVNPNVTQEELAEISYETAIVNKEGLRIINPRGIIEAVKEMLQN